MVSLKVENLLHLSTFRADDEILCGALIDARLLDESASVLGEVSESASASCVEVK